MTSTVSILPASPCTAIGAPTFYNYILDLSMATDLVISYCGEKPLAVQLTLSNPNLLDPKQNEWKKTLKYWKIDQGVLFSQAPNHSISKSAKTLLRHSNSLENNCYIVNASEK